MSVEAIMKNLLFSLLFIWASFSLSAQPVWQKLAIPDLPADGATFDVSAVGNKFYVGTNYGIMVYDAMAGSWSKLTDTTFGYNAAATTMSDMEHDALGNLWVALGKSNYGLMRYDGTSWKRFDIGDGLDTARSFRQIAINPTNGEMWFLCTVLIHEYIANPGPPPVWQVSIFDELFRFDGQTFTRVWNYKRGSIATGLAISADGRSVWVALPQPTPNAQGKTLYGQLMRRDAKSGELTGEIPISWNFPDPIQQPWITGYGSDFWSLVCDKDDGVWFQYPYLYLYGGSYINGGLLRYNPLSNQWDNIVENNPVYLLHYGTDSTIRYCRSESKTSWLYYVKNSVTTRSVLQEGIGIDLAIGMNGAMMATRSNHVLFTTDDIGVTGIEESSHLSDALSPNPVTPETPFLRLPIAADGTYDAFVCDVSGRSIRVQLQNNADQLLLPVAELNLIPGVYAVRVCNSGGWHSYPFVIR